MEARQLHCTDCHETTKHTPKLDAVKSGYQVCTECSKMNTYQKYRLIRERDGKEHVNEQITYVKFNDDRTFKEERDKPSVGLSVLLGPQSMNFTWLTTPITEILEQTESYLKFKTENSAYELYTNNN